MGRVAGATVRRTLAGRRSALRVDYWAVAAAVVAAMLVSSVWYSPFLFGRQWLGLSGAGAGTGAGAGMPASKMLVELLRELVVAYVLARLARLGGVADWKGALSLGFWMWLGFPVAMLVGASLWDDKPWMLSAIHGGDWFVKMLVMAVIVGVWRRESGAAGGT
jgi:hypothetical protein